MARKDDEERGCSVTIDVISVPTASGTVTGMIAAMWGEVDSGGAEPITPNGNSWSFLLHDLSPGNHSLVVTAQTSSKPPALCLSQRTFTVQ